MVKGVAAAVAWLALLLLPAVAQADRAFSPRFSTNTQGDIAIVSNSLESCLDALPVCGNVRSAVGGAIPANNNNQRTMTWVDVDGDPATFDSSSADLTLPAGASVLFAGLYYGGRLTAGSGGSPAPTPGARNTVLFKAPGDTDYRSLTASQVDAASTQYQGFVNVTPIVEGAGSGTYTTANVQLGTGLSDSSSGGWALIVAYGDSGSPSRNLSVFDGIQTVTGNGTVTIPLSGFQTPLTGPVTSTVGVVAYEGDLGTNGDGAQIQGATGFTPLTNAANAENNVFNSTISNAGAFVTSRTPSFQNNLGYDADLFSTGRARQRADEHAGEAVDQRRRLPARCGDDRDRPVRAQDRRDEDRRQRNGQPRRHADLHRGRGERRAGRRDRHHVQRPHPGRRRVRPRQHHRRRSPRDRRGR